MVAAQKAVDKIAARLTKIGGLSRRKVATLSTSLSSASRWKRDDIGSKLEKKLLKLGLSKRKAYELAKALVPTVRSLIKARASVVKTTSQVENSAMVDAINGATDTELDTVAPLVNGHRVRLDLPTLPVNHGAVVENVLTVMHGYSTSNTYLVAAIRKEGDVNGVVAIRKFGENSFKLKFYPTMAHWGFTRDQLHELGGNDYLQRNTWYQRMMFNLSDATQVLQRIAAEEESRLSRGQKLLKHLRAVSMNIVNRALDILATRKQVAA